MQTAVYAIELAHLTLTHKQLRLQCLSLITESLDGVCNVGYGSDFVQTHAAKLVLCQYIRKMIVEFNVLGINVLCCI